MTHKHLKSEVHFMGSNKKGYPGAFPDNVERIIRQILTGSQGRILHLFSGTSDIGNVRVDLKRPEATINTNVFDFIKTDDAKGPWEWCLLDPPYIMKSPIKEYADQTSVAASVPKRRALGVFFLNHCANVLWFDFCAPLPSGFYREKIMFFLPGGYRHVRTLSWLKREGQLKKYIAKLK